MAEVSGLRSSQLNTLIVIITCVIACCGGRRPPPLLSDGVRRSPTNQFSLSPKIYVPTRTIVERHSAAM